MTPLKANTLISFILLFVLLILSAEVSSQRRRQNLILNPAAPMGNQEADTLKSDSSDVPSIKKKQALSAPVVYEANDSIVFTQGGYAHLYGEGKVNYEKIELDAQVISMNMDSSTVYAHGISDSLGTLKGTPVFKDGETDYETKTIRYNFKNKKGFISNVVSQQGEGYVTGHNAKKGPDDDLFMANGRYTTCDHHEHPHFYLQLTRAKVRPKKNVITGPAYLVVEDVPLPIAVPFFFFPFSSSYSSGFIMPTYMDDSSRGFGLTGGGYYFALNDKMDLKVLADVFTKGSWAFGAQSTYNKRYKYSGTFQTNYQVTKTGDKGLPDYLVAKDFKIVWSHRQDAKASPNSTFSASVNFSTSSYERTNINNLYNSSLLTQGTKTSSVSYSRSFPDQNLTISSTFNIAQTLRDSSVAVTLPDLNISLSRIYPFKRKSAVGDERWYEKISLSYTGRLTNSITTQDDKLFKSNLIKDWNNGMSHNIPVSATFTLFKYFNVTPSFNYTERWYTRKIMQGWDGVNKERINTDTIYGFHRVYNYNTSLGVSTKLYGMYKPLFAKSKEIQIRHVITPQVTLSMAPDFGSSKYGYWKSYSYRNASNELDTVTYSPYAKEPFGVPGQGKQGNVSFDISNNVEVKYKDKNDSIQKFSLIDELGAGISYNMAAKTRPWSDLSVRLRLKLSKNYTLNLNSSFATYAYTFDKNGNVVIGDRTEWSYGRFGRFQGWSSSFNYTFNNDTWKKWFGSKDEKNDKKKGVSDGESTDIQEEESDTQSKPKKVEKAKVDADGYQQFSMPWSLNFNYSYGIREDTSKPINEKSMRYPFRYTQNLSFSGSIKISNRWNMSFNSGYDFDAHKIIQTAFTVTRDLHCWNMSASISPIGAYRYYNFTIRANASILQDLKWDQRSQTQSNIQWY
ncbi:putative LPS assembly protein LptD [uncultured Bacteroides sp.]|uniref:putative LPS assembly protein LptD n=1 Tax=uncultured Bacteroides sp. TaxID=162156 RepID=UPI002AAB8009|nr:putative LPS assembly protein LptD [uncultured Bacteroides sp.]